MTDRNGPKVHRGVPLDLLTKVKRSETQTRKQTERKAKLLCTKCECHMPHIQRSEVSLWGVIPLLLVSLGSLSLSVLLLFVLWLSYKFLGGSPFHLPGARTVSVSHHTQLCVHSGGETQITIWREELSSTEPSSWSSTLTLFLWDSVHEF